MCVSNPSSSSQKPFQFPQVSDKDKATSNIETTQSFVEEQDAWDKVNCIKHQDRIERANRVMDACVAELHLPTNKQRLALYHNISQYIAKATLHFFADFRHTDIATLKKAAMQKLGKPDTIHKEIDRTETDGNYTTEQVNHALLLEDAQQSELRAKHSSSHTITNMDIPEPSARHVQLAKEWSSILNGELFQPDNIKEALIELGIHNNKYKVMPN